MKIAVTLENGEVFQHFGHTQTFLIAETDGDGLTTRVLDAQGSGHGALAALLRENGVQVLICGGIGGGAKNALREDVYKRQPITPTICCTPSTAPLARTRTSRTGPS